MKHWITFFVAVLLNLAGIFFALSPGLVTYAEVPPKEISCSLCSTPEVQQALIRAVALGRSQISGLLQSNTWLIITVGAINVVLIGGLLLVSALTRRSSGHGKSAAPLS